MMEIASHETAEEVPDSNHHHTEVITSINQTTRANVGEGLPYSFHMGKHTRTLKNT
jgi:ribosomal protein L3